MTRALLGAYGLRIEGLAEAQQWMQPLPDRAPRLWVEKTRIERESARESWLQRGAADVRLIGGGRLRIRQTDRRARFSFPEPPSDEDLLHPYLAPAAALLHLWAGREAWHAGAFATSRGAVAVLAEKGAGKSTTLAWLASHHEAAVLSDDLVVVRRESVLSGPRCLDLRDDTPVHDFDLEAVRPVRNAERLRVTLSIAPHEAPLIATALLRWGQHTRVERPAPADRLRELLPHRMFGHRVAGDPQAILKLAALPMVIITRPRGRDGLQATGNLLLDYVG